MSRAGMARRRDPSAAVLSRESDSLTFVNDGVSDWDVMGRSARSSRSKSGAEILVTELSMIETSSTAADAGEEKGDKAGAESADMEVSLTADMAGGVGMSNGAASQNKTTKSTRSDPAASNRIPKRLILITVPLPSSPHASERLKLIISRQEEKRPFVFECERAVC